MTVYRTVNDFRQRNSWTIENQTYLRCKYRKLPIDENVQTFCKAVWTFVKVYYSGT